MPSPPAELPPGDGLRAFLRAFAVPLLNYLVFGGGLFAYAAVRAGRRDIAAVALLAVVNAVWAAGLSAGATMVASSSIASRWRRVGGAAVLGALSMAGFGAALSFASGAGSLDPKVIAAGGAAGLLMHGARAFSMAPIDAAADDDDDDDSDSDQAPSA